MLHVPPPTNRISLFCNKSGQSCRLRKVVAESLIVVLFLATKSLYVARFTDPRQTCIVASDVDPSYGVTPAKFYPIRSQYSHNLQPGVLWQARFLPPPPPPPPLRFFWSFFLNDKASAADVFSSCLFIPHAHLETSLVMVSYYGYEIWHHK